MRSSRACSGEAYDGAARRGTRVAPASPKPVTTTGPLSRTKTWPGLSSPCVMPSSCAAWSTSSSSRPVRAARTGWNAPSRSRSSHNGVPSIHSVTVHRVPFSTTASTTVATWPGHSSRMVSEVRMRRAVTRRTVSSADPSGRAV